MDLRSLTGLKWSLGHGSVRLCNLLVWTGEMSRCSALGGAPQEAPPFAAVLLLKGMQSSGLLHKGGCGPSPLATFEKTICLAVWLEVSASHGVLWSLLLLGLQSLLSRE